MQVQYEVSDSEYRELLDDIYPMVNICGCEYYAGTVLEAVDPITFRCAKSDYESERLADLEDGAHYEVSATYFQPGLGGGMEQRSFEVDYTGSDSWDDEAIQEAILEDAPEGTTLITFEVVLKDSEGEIHGEDSGEICDIFTEGE